MKRLQGLFEQGFQTELTQLIRCCRFNLTWQRIWGKSNDYQKAIEMLTIEGLVLSKQGNGTKVLNSSFWDKEDSRFRLNNYNGLSHDMKDDSRKLTSKIIEFTVEFPDVEIAERLQVEQSAPVYKIIRLRLLDGKPYALEHTYMACDLVPGLDDSILLASVYDYLWNTLHLKFAGSYRHITAENLINTIKTI